jgi:hypothetical protein
MRGSEKETMMRNQAACVVGGAGAVAADPSRFIEPGDFQLCTG